MTKPLRAALIFMMVLATPFAAKGDPFGGDVVVLTQLLTNALQQLLQLQQILDTTRNNLDLLQDLNNGLNDVLMVVNTVG